MTRRVEVTPYDKEWPLRYQEEVSRIEKVLKPEVVSIHHIGSTSIPGMYAKPIIDIMIEVRDISKIDEYNEKMIDLGYEPRGELGIPGRRYFSREQPKDVRTHHVHMYQSGDENLIRHIAFREYMIAHPEDAATYAKLKMKLAKENRYDIDAYIAGKESYVDKMEKIATVWYLRQIQNES